MKLMISYFTQIRNFRLNMLPLSTAMWGPRWYHNFGDRNTTFVDKRGIYNGLVFQPFVPDHSCEGICQGDCVNPNPKSCSYLRNYRTQLDALDFRIVRDRVEMIATEYITKRDISEEPIVAFMVYEAPNNPCSERWVLKDWFRSHGVNLKEFNHQSSFKLFNIQ